MSKFQVWDRVRIRDKFTIKALRANDKLAFWWNEQMYELCDRDFTITWCTDTIIDWRDIQAIFWLDTKWDISSDMIEHIPKMDDRYRTAAWTVSPKYQPWQERIADEKRREEAVRDWAGIEKRPESRMFADIPMCDDRPLYTPEAGPCAPDSVMDTMRYRAMRDWSAVMRIDPGQVAPGSEKSKSRLSFSKIK